MRGPLTGEQCDDVKKYVVDMFEECGITTYPIDPFEIARKLFYVLRPYSELSFSECLEAYEQSNDAFSRVEFSEERQRNEYVIYYNDIGKTPNRIRWSLLHEIGHCYMGHHDHPDDSLYVIEEAEANLFAKYSIAPVPLIHVLKLQNGYDVARVFVTTDDAGYNCYSYYQKWLQFGPQNYTDFEIRLLRLFKIAA